jgi:hypothetical protein
LKSGLEAACRLKEGGNVKTISKRTLATFSVAIVLAGSVFGQSISLRAHIPFDFRLGNQTLQSGDYIVRVVNGSGLAIESVNGGRSAVSLTFATRAPGHVSDGQLVFTRYGDNYFLSRAFWPGYENGLEFPKSNAEREAIASQIRPEPLKLKVTANR